MDRDYEEEAREQGWKPEEEWSNPDKPWVDAKTFIEKGEKIAGIATKQRDEFKSRLERTEQEVQSLKQANKEYGDYQKELREKERNKAQQRINELETQLAQAVTDADGQEFTRLNRELDKERDSLNTKENGDAPLDPLAQAWLMNNDWYNTNRKLQTYADGLAEQIVNEGYTGSAYYSELSRRVKNEFPEEFQNKRQERSNAVETGGELETESKAQTYENLPPESKAACDRFVKSGVTTIEDYVANYDWDE